MQAEGPKQPRVQQQAAVVTEAQRSLLQRWDEIRQDPDYTDSYVEFRSIADRLRRATLTTTLAAMEIRSLMDEWRQQLLQQGRTTELCGFDRGLQHFQDPFSFVVLGGDMGCTSTGTRPLCTDWGMEVQDTSSDASTKTNQVQTNLGCTPLFGEAPPIGHPVVP